MLVSESERMAEYANESGVICDCGDGNFECGELLDSGVQPGTSDGPAVHWFTGTVTCRCGRVTDIADSD